MTATRINGNDWKRGIIGDKVIPKNMKSKWKICLENINGKSGYDWTILIGIGPNNPNNEENFYTKCWSFIADKSEIYNGKCLKYNNHSGRLKKGDIVGVIVDRQNQTLSFKVNGTDYGIAFNDIPKDDELYPTINIYPKDFSISIV